MCCQWIFQLLGSHFAFSWELIRYSLKIFFCWMSSINQYILIFIHSRLKPGKDPVFNLVSTHYHKDLTWDKFMWFNENAHVQQRLEATVAVWPYSFRLENWRLKYEIECVQMHIIPAIIFDTMLRLAGKPPMWVHKFHHPFQSNSEKHWMDEYISVF